MCFKLKAEKAGMFDDTVFLAGLTPAHYETPKLVSFDSLMNRFLIGNL